MYIVVAVISNNYIMAKVDDENLENYNAPLMCVDKNKLLDIVKMKPIENYEFKNGILHYSQGSEKSLIVKEGQPFKINYFLLSKIVDNEYKEKFRLLAFDGEKAVIKILNFDALVSIYKNKMLLNAHIVNSDDVKPFVKLNAGVLKEIKYNRPVNENKSIFNSDGLELSKEESVLFNKYKNKPVNNLIDMVEKESYSSKEKDFLKKHKLKRFGSSVKKALALGAVCVALGGTLCACNNTNGKTSKNTISAEMTQKSQQIVFDYTNNTVRVGADEYKMKKINGSTYFEDKDGNLLSEIQNTKFHDIKNHKEYNLDESIKDGYKYTTAIDENANEIFSIRRKLSDIKENEVDSKVSIEIKDKSGNYVPALMESRNVYYTNSSDYSFINLLQKSNIFRIVFFTLITYVVLEIKDIVRDERKKKKLNRIESDVFNN